MRVVLDYSSAGLEQIKTDETLLAFHWILMSPETIANYKEACENGSRGQYLKDLQRLRSDLDMPRFTVARVDLKTLDILITFPTTKD